MSTTVDISTRNKDGEFDTTSSTTNTNIKLQETDKKFQSIVKDVMTYKKDNDGLSPIQAEAKQNEKNNNTGSIISGVISGVGTIIGFIPNPIAKGVGSVLKTTGGLVKSGVKIANPTDPENINRYYNLKK